MDYIHELRRIIGPRKLILNCAGALIIRDGKILLQRRTDNGQWGLIGGLLEMNETYEEAALREIREETGLQVRLDSFLGIFHNHNMVWSNGDAAHVISAMFTASIIRGEPRINEESSELRFFGRDEMPELFAEDHIACLDAYFRGVRYPLMQENRRDGTEASPVSHLRYAAILTDYKMYRFIIALQDSIHYPLVFLREWREDPRAGGDYYLFDRKALTFSQAEEILDQMKAGDTRKARALLKGYLKDKKPDCDGVGPVVLDDMIPDEWYDAWKKMEHIITASMHIAGYWEAELS